MLSFAGRKKEEKSVMIHGWERGFLERANKMTTIFRSSPDLHPHRFVSAH